ncbi:MAG: hypothetical protein JWN48_3741 [Myxococcaceae bacterium]|nr:hypothetical protein [Myxococcaceae bacterium]
MTKLLNPLALCVGLLVVGCGSDDSAISGEGDARAAVLPDAGTKKSDSGLSTSLDPATVGSPDDRDGDGFSKAEGDCDETEPKVNPGAYDFPGDSLDDDCSGSAARAGEDCDTGLALDSTDAKDAARAIGLCKFVDESAKGWGVVSARFTNATGAGSLADPRGVGLLPSLGAAKPSQGAALLALSSGVARAPDETGYTQGCDALDSCPFGLCTGQKPPDGYPKESSTCHPSKDVLSSIFGTGSTIFDQSALEVKIRVPNNVSSLSFESIFYTYEYPHYVCSKYNDFYVVFKDPKPAGVSDGNIVFDSNGDPVGVNTGLLAVCDPSGQDPTAQKHFDCAQGTALLQGSGFGPGETSCKEAGGAATGWLHTTAPVEKSQIITLRFAIWDTNDQQLDSTVLIDKFEWSAKEGDVATTPVLAI